MSWLGATTGSAISETEYEHEQKYEQE